MDNPVAIVDQLEYSLFPCRLQRRHGEMMRSNLALAAEPEQRLPDAKQVVESVALPTRRSRRLRARQRSRRGRTDARQRRGCKPKDD